MSSEQIQRNTALTTAHSQVAMSASPDSIVEEMQMTEVVGASTEKCVQKTAPVVKHFFLRCLLLALLSTTPDTSC